MLLYLFCVYRETIDGQVNPSCRVRYVAARIVGCVSILYRFPLVFTCLSPRNIHVCSPSPRMSSSASTRTPRTVPRLMTFPLPLHGHQRRRDDLAQGLRRAREGRPEGHLLHHRCISCEVFTIKDKRPSVGLTRRDSIYLLSHVVLESGPHFSLLQQK